MNPFGRLKTAKEIIMAMKVGDLQEFLDFMAPLPEGLGSWLWLQEALASEGTVIKPDPREDYVWE